MKKSIPIYPAALFILNTTLCLLPAFSYSQSIAAGGYHSIILCSSGNVKTTGANWDGQLGDGTYNDAYTPVLVSGLTGVTAVSGGYYHTLALKNDSTVWAWGYNGYGQLGDSTWTERLTPVKVYGLTGIVAIAAGAYHSLAVKSDGTAWAWGYNGYGQLGDSTTTSSIIPVKVKTITGITSVSGGGYHSLALKNDGTVWGWGANSNGQLGDNTPTQRTTPVQVHGLNDVGFLTGITVIGTGWYHSLARKSDSTAWAWGYNGYGNLGDGTYTQRSTPIQVVSLANNVTTLGAGYYHSLFVISDGTAWACGQNWEGDLGDGTNIDKITPVQMLGLTGVIAVAGGYEHSVILKSDATYWACGYNYEGQVGDGTNNNERWTAVQMHDCCINLPKIALSDTCRAMDTTVQGGTSQKIFYIRNIACDTLLVSSFSSSEPAFTVAPSSLLVPAYDSALVTISFSPTSLGGYSGTLTIFNNDNDTTICLTGFSVPAPTNTVNPSSFTLNLACGDSLTDTLFISNTGAPGSELIYSVAGNGMFDSTSQVNITLGDQIINHIFSGTTNSPDTLFLVLTLNGDYNSASEYTELYIDGSYQGVVPDTTSSYTDFTRYYIFTGPQVDAWFSDGVVTVMLDNSPSVGSGGFERVRLYYSGAFPIWLTPNPVQGATPQGGTDTIIIDFNTSGLVAGAYNTPIYIYSNDPANLIDTIPVTLNVIGFSDFQFTALADTAPPLCLDLDSIMASMTSTDTIIIANAGCGILFIDSFLFSSSLFTIASAPSLIMPGNTGEIVIRFSPVAQGSFSGTVTIYTNDIDTAICLKGIAFPSPVESHNPDSFNVTLGCTDSIINTLTVYNTGGSDLYFQLEGGGNQKIKVALVPAEDPGYITDVQTKLMSTGKFTAVDILDARFTTPTLAQLQAYDAILTWTDYSYNNATTLGNNLADYVDGGGGVVAAIFTTGNYSRIQGRFNTDNYWAINPTGYTSGGSPAIGTIYNPSHPILNNVSSFIGNGGNSYRPSSTAIMAGAVKVADWTDGMPLVVTKQVNGKNRVDLGLWPPSSDIGGGWLSSSDGAILMANALFYSKYGNSAGWMTLVPSTDTVAPTDSSLISVTFNSTGLIAGTYTGSITITSNDPVNSTDSIPVTLNVIGFPEIAFSDTCVVFDTIFQFATITDSFYISNPGCDTLVLDSLIPTNNEFSVVSYPSFIEPWDSGKIVVRFSPVTINTFNELLNIYSNLPDTAYCLFAVSLPPPTINVYPDSFTVTLSCSDSITLPLLISNTGAWNLIWTANALSSLSDDFDPGIDPSAWSFTDGAANLNCGSLSGNALFMDNYPTRQAATIDLNTINGGSIKFYLKLGNNVPGSCEYLDAGNEVYLQYSNNGGGSWNNILTFNSGTYASFTLVNQAIPPAAKTISTRFRVWQPNPDCFGCDNWAIDDFSIDFTSFVTLSLTSDTTPVSDTSLVNVEFNSAGLLIGTYYSQIIINSNDPITPVDTVPLTLNVVGSGILTPSDNCLYLDSIMEFTTEKDSLYVKNTGCDTLFISNLSSLTTDFTFILSSDTILMGDSAKVVVTFVPTSTGDFFDTLTVFSNTGDSLICLSGKAFARPVISVDPDSFIVTLACASSSTDTLTIYNTGLNYLNYNIDTGNYSLLLDGTGDWVNRGVVNLPTATSQLTIEAWIYPVAYSGDASYTGVVSWGARGCTGNGILLSIQNNGRPSMATWCNDFVPGTGAAATLNQWNHIALVRNGTSITLYMNGTPVSGTISSSIIYGSLNLAIGSTDYPGRYFNGRMDEIRVWNKARSTGEILATMNKRLYGNEPGLVSYWNFDKQNATDKTTTGNNGTLNGNATFIYDSPFNSYYSLNGNLSDTLNPGDSTKIAVNFNSTGLTVGTYSDSLAITSNDPLGSPLVVPVTVNVIGTGKITLRDTCLYLDSIMEFTTNKDTFYIVNTGCDTLKVTDITTQTTIYSVSGTQFDILAGDSAMVAVTFAPTSVGILYDTLTITNSDVTKTLCLSGYGFPRPVISVNPDSFNITLVCADTLVDTLTVYNTGLTDLIFSTGLSGKSAVFDGSGDYIDVPDNNSLDLPATVTFETWLYVNTIQETWTSIIGKPGRNYTMWLNSSRYIHLSYYGPGNTTINTPVNSINLNQWHHVAGVIDVPSGVMKVYIDGVQQASGSTTGSANLSGSPFRMGNNLDGGAGNYLNGKLDEVRVWNIARTQSEIQSTMNKSLTGLETGLVGYWTFDDGTAVDISVNTNNGAFYGNATTAAPNAPVIFASTWMNYSLLTDTIAYGDSVKIPVTVSSAGLIIGQYISSVILSSNDPLNNPDTIPVILNVIGAGEMTLTDNCLYLDSIMEFTTDKDTLYIKNTGCDTLLISNLSSLTTDFTFILSSDTVFMGDSAEVVVTFEPTSTGDFFDTLTVFSNAGDSLICLSGKAFARPVISVAPDSFIVTLTCSDTTIVPLTIYNTGGSDLVFNIDTADYYAKFDGVDDYIRVNTIYPSLNTVTIEAWIYPTTTSGVHWIISNGRDCCTPTGGFNLYYSGTTLTGLIWRSAGSNQISASSASGLITVNTWQHVAMVYDGTKIQLFRNGVLVATSAIYASSSVLDGSNNLHIGILAYSVPNFYEFLGNIDDVRIWNNIRSQSEIIADMNKKLVGNEAGLKGYWNFEKQNANDVTPYANNGTFFGNSSIGQYPYNLFYTVSATTDTVPVGDSSIVNVTISSTGLLVGAYYDNIFITSNDPLSTIDTIPITLQVVGTPILALSDTCLLFDTIMEFTTQTKMLWLYNTGCDTLFIDSLIPTAGEFTLVSVLNYIVPGDSDFASIRFAPVDTGNFAGTLNIYSNVNDTSVCLIGNAYPRPVATFSPDTFLVILVCADTLNDTLTIYNTGLTDLIYSPFSNDTGRSALFDGVNDYANMGTWFNYQTFTIELWVRTGSTQKQYADIIDNNHTGARSWVLQQNSTNTNQFGWGTNDGGGSALFTLIANQWTHLAMTRDGITRTNKVYINGSLFSTWVGTGNIPYDGTQFFRLARWGGGGREWNGTMDEVRVWNIERTQPQISSTMFKEISGNTAGLIGYWNFDGNNANDLSDYGNNGTFVNGAYAGPPNAPVSPFWVNFSTVSDTITSGDSAKLAVEFISTGLLVGQYTSNIFINSNDPLNSPDTIPVILNVTGTGEITLSDTCLDFDTIMEFTTASDTFLFTNTGCDTLTGFLVSSSGHYSLNTAGNDSVSINLLPDDLVSVVVIFAPDSVGPFNASVNITTNVGDSTVCLIGNTFPRPEICYSPDSFNIYFPVCLDSVTIPYMVCNTGGSNLDFSLWSHYGRSIALDGSGDWVGIPDNATLRLTTNFTLEAWIKPASVTSYMQIISKFPWSSNYSYQMNTTNTGKLRLDLSSNGTTYSAIVSTASITPGVWTHVAATRNGTTVKLYINGAEETFTLSFSGPLFSAATSVDIGRVSGSNNQLFTGQIDEVRIYNRTLTSSEIVNSMNATLTGNETGLQGYWNFEDGTAVDLSPNTNNGTRNGNAYITLPTAAFIPATGTVPPSGTDTLLARFWKAGLPFGTTGFPVYLVSNDPFNTEVVVPADLFVDSLPPAPPVAADRNVCSGDPVPDMIAVGTGDTVKWYDLTPTLIFTGDTFATGESAVGIYSYIVNQTDTNGCVSTSDTVTLAINAAPTEPVANDTTVCSDVAIPSLSSTGTIIQWYSDGALTNLLFTGNPYNTGQTLPNSYTYYVNDSTGACPASPADTVTLTINNAATVNAGVNDVICEGSTYTLAGIRGGGATSSTWTTSGSGTFSDSSLLAAVYTPSLVDISMGSVTLTLTTDDPDGAGPCTFESDVMTLTINPAALVNAGADDTICSGSTYTLSGSRGGSATSSTWTTLGSGTFNNASLLAAVYTPSPADITAQSVALVLTTNDPAGPCSAVRDTMVITINIAGTVNAGADAPVCSGNTYTLSGAIGGGASSSAWTTSGSGTFNDSSLLAAVYTHSSGDSSMGNVTLTITTNDPDSSGPCSAVSDAMVLTINTAPGEPVANDTTVCSDVTIPSLSSTGTIIQWYSDGALLNLLFTGNPYNTGQTLPAAYTYYVTDSTGACPESPADTVTLTINNAATVDAGINATICAGDVYTLAGVRGGGASSSVWTSSGSGTFNDSSLMGAVYTPSLADIAMGNVTLTLTTNDPDGAGPCTVESDFMIITINPAATVNAGVDDTICSGSTYTLSGSRGGSATSSSWTTLGSGTFNNATLLTATYTPSASDISAGSVSLILSTNDPAGPCPAVTDTMVITINIAGTANAGTDSPLCAGDAYTLSGAIGGGAVTVTWTTSGSGIFNDSSLLAAIYTPSVGDISAGTVILTITTNDPDGAGPCVAVSDIMTLSINPPPVVPTATDTTICSGASVPSLTANGTIVQWYSDGALTILVNTGTTYNTGQTLPAVYNYYVTDSTAGCPETVADTSTLAINDAATVSAGSDDALCEGNSYILSGTRGGGATTSVWTTTGTGTFSDSSLLASVYSPSAADISAGTVTLAITTNDPDGGGPCVAVSDSMILNINAPAVKPTGTDVTACSDGAIPPLTATGTILQWYSDPGLSTLVYTGTSYNTGQTATGAYDYYVTDSTTGCPESSSDTVTLTINNAATANAGSDSVICEGDVFTLTGVIGGGAASSVWTTSGSGTFSDSSLLSAVYTSSLSDISMGSVTLTLTTDDPDLAGPCAPAIDAMVLTINPAAIVNAGVTDTICQGGTSSLSGTIGGGASSATWITYGDGTFDDVALLTATYTPGNTDISTGTVLLQLISNDPTGPCPAAANSVSIIINTAATVDAGSDGTICDGDVAILAGLIGGSASSSLWITSGTGLFNDTTSVFATYTPSAADISSGSVTLTLSTNDPDSAGPCTAVSDAVVITINPLPAAPVASQDTMVCFGTPVPDLYATGGVNIQWYSDPALTLLVNSGDTFTTGQTAGGVYTYYITQSVNNCEGAADSVTLTIFQVPLPDALDTSICIGDTTPTLTATGTNVKWYSDSLLTVLVATGNTYNSGDTATGIYDYYVTDSLNGCVSASDTSTLIISTPNIPPASATADADSICEGAPVNLAVVGGVLGIGAQWKWYAGSCGGAVVTTGDSVAVNPLVTTTYFVRGEGGCDTTACVSVTVNVTQFVSVAATSATTSVDSICSGVTSSLGITGGTLGTGASWQWYSDSCGGAAIGTGSSVNVNPAVTTSYFARAEGTCNTTPCQSVTVNVTQTVSVDVTAIISTADSICPNTPVDLTLSGGTLGTGATWQWYLSSCGTTPLGSGDTLSISPSVTSNYYVRAEGVCNTTACDSITVSVTQSESVTPVSINSSASTICAGDQVTLSVSGGSLGTGAQYYWYDSNCGVSLTGTGDSITFAPLSTGSWYVRAEGNCNTTLCVSTGITVNPVPSAPASSDVTVCENDPVPDLIASGTNVQWYSDSALTALVSSGDTFVTGITAPGTYVYYSTQTASACQSPATVVTLTINGLPPAPSSANVNVCSGQPVPDLTATGSNINWYGDVALTTLVGTGNNYATGETAIGSYTYYATQTVAGCEGPAVAVTLNILSSPPPPVVSDVSVCEGMSVPPFTTSGNIIRWYSNPGLTNLAGTGNTFNTGQTAPGTYTYYVTDSLPGCVSSAEDAVLTITPMPAKPVGTGATVCYGDAAAALTATGSNPRWYKDPTLVIQLGTGNSYTPTITNVGTWYIYVTDYISGCPQSASDTVPYVVDPKPLVTLNTNSTAIALGDSVQLIAYNAVSYAWTPSAGLSNTTGQSVWASPTTPTWYYVTGTNQYNCTNTDSVYVNVKGTGVMTVIPGEEFDLKVYPNPTSDKIMVEFSLSSSASENPALKIFNMIGGLIADTDLQPVTPANGSSPAYTYRKEINFSEKAEGVYYIQLVTGETALVRKVVVVR
ncbi:MAG: choice-of-anchor D domain-containing protein [Bacteroidetes bacterium]|nr:choice-of-anchor D domain-containing protein [Bacteroidota bacterium]